MVMSNTPARKKEGVGTEGVGTVNPFFLALSLTVGILVGGEIELSTRYVKV